MTTLNYPQSKSSKIAQILLSIRRLETHDQLALMQELTNLLRIQLEQTRGTRRVTEFRGVGKRTFQSLNVADYLRSERESWD